MSRGTYITMRESRVEIIVNLKKNKITSDATMDVSK